MPPTRARRVLMLARGYPPCSLYPTASARARGFARGLAELGWHPTVLAPVPSTVCHCDGCASDPDGASEMADVTRLRLSAGRSFREARPSGRRPVWWAIEAAPRHLRAWFSDLDPESDWPRVAVATGCRLHEALSFDVIWATAQPLSSLWAADKLSRACGIPWVADIRDCLAMPRAPQAFASAAPRARARRILRRAHDVIEVSPQHALRESRWLRRACVSIPSGFDPADWADVAPAPARDALELVCAARMYAGDMTLDAFFAGLRHLAERDGADDVRFTYYGRSVDEVRQAARLHGVGDLVTCRGFVAPRELRPALAAAHVLVLPTNVKGHSGFPGGKLYEYLAARRPILAVPGDDEFVLDVLRRTRAGRGATTPPEVAEAISTARDTWKTSGTLSFEGDLAEIEEFSIHKGARRLARLLEDAVEPVGDVVDS